MSLIDKFTEISEVYDSQRKQLIPCFDDLYTIPIKVMSYPNKNPKVLDIGAGTGLFSKFLLQKYPNSNITLIDLSEEMLNIAKKRFNNYNFKYIVDDYTTHDFNVKFDIIISALSIHHIPEEGKRKLYQKCANLIEENGIFINLDQVLSPSTKIESRFLNLVDEATNESGINEIEAIKAHERRQFDDPSSLNIQLNWLKEFGFKDVDVIYKYYNFAAIYAIK